VRLTLNNVAAAIFDKHGHKVELVKGNGYYYFASAEEDCRTAPISYAYGHSVYVNGLWCYGTVERWVSEYEDLIKDVIVPEDATEDRTKPITLIFR
jgi:hypothetical protein